MDLDIFVATRRSLHGVGELLLAGPAYADHGDIRLVPTPGGFGIWRQPGPRVAGPELALGSVSVPLRGSIASIGAAAGVVPRDLSDVYHDGAGLTVEAEVIVSADAAALVADAFDAGARALAAFAPDAEAVLWPEHFDIGISAGEVNYGVSAGDGFEPWPYAYVGPWVVPTGGDFWNAPFGAARRLDELDSADPSGAIAEFFATGRDLSAA